MKTNFICFKISKTIMVLLLVILIQIAFIIVGIKELRESRNLEQISNEVKIEENVLQESKNEINFNISNETNLNKKDDVKIEKKEELEEYKDMPREKKGYKIIGKIEIPKLNLDTYILDETNTKSLKVSVTKLYGPKINTVGNFCIAGHNYRNNKMFGGIKKLVEGDEIFLTDTFSKKVKYKVYANFQTSPKDVTALQQETQGEREVTLITCTAGAIKRVIVKAIEDYD